MKTLYTILFFIFLSFGALAQPKLFTGEFDNQSGTGGSKDYSTGWTFEGSAFSSYRFVASVGSTGDSYFRFRNNANTTDRQPSGADGTSIPTNQTSAFTAVQDGNTKAFKVAGAVTGYRYIFKVDAAINNIAIFEIQGTNVRTVTAVTRTTPSGTVYPGQDVLITATLSGAFDAGQSSYLRYTTDAWATSSVIKMSGSGTSYTATIPGVDNKPSTQNQYYVFTSGDVASIATTDADLFTINANNNGGSNYNYTPAAGWTTAAAGNWGTAGTWVANAVPPTGASMGAVSIGHAVTLNQSAIANSVNLSAATPANLTLNAGQTLSIASGGSINRSSTAIITANATSTVRFLGAGSIGWLNTWGNLETGGALTTTGVQTITTSFQINSGGSVSAAPTYTTTSTLIYNSGGSYGVGNEWTATADAAVGSGLPQNVTIQNSTTLNMTTTTRAMAGNLTISSGTLALNATSGDLSLRGNWSNSGTFTPNSRAVFFRGTTTSTVSKSGGETFDYLVLAKTTAFNLQLLSNVTVAGGSGFPLQLSNTISGGGIDLNGFDLTLSGAASSILIGNASAFIRNISGTGNLIITTGTKTVSRNALAAGTLVIASTVNVQLSNGIDFGASLTTHNGTLTINAGGFVTTNPPIYAATSSLVYNSGGAYACGAEWNATTDNIAGSGRPQNVTIQNSTTLNMPATSHSMAGNLNISSGALVLNATAGDLLIRGNWSNSGTFTPSGRAVFFMGTAASTVSKTGGETFDYLIVQKTGVFNLQFLSNVTVAASSGNVLQLNNTGTSCGIDLNGFDLSLTGTSGNIDLAAGALSRTISGTGNVFISGGTKTVTRSATSTLALATTVNVQLSNGINFGASITTLNGTLTINSGGFVSTNPPLYGLTSNLIYNSGGSYALSSEWTSAIATATVTAGRPGNVTIQNNTDLTMTTTDRSLYGNLNISSGSLSLSAVSGNFLVGGNWTRSAAGATFNQNGRTVQFFSVASGLSTTITRTGGETFGNVTLSKGTLTGLNVNLACDVVINGLLTMTTGVIVIGSNNLTLNGTVASMTTTNGLSGTANSTLTIGGSTTTLGTLAFITAAQRLGTLSINRTSVPSGTAAVTLNSNLLVDNGSGLNNSSFSISNGILTVNALMTLTVANTSSTGSNASGFVFTATTGRFAYSVTGAGTYSLTYPLGSSAVTSPTAYRPLDINSLVQSATNTYSAASTAGAGSGVFSVYTAPIVGVSTVRYFPFSITTLANLTSIGSVSLVIGADETPVLDNLVISQVISSSWQNLGGTGTSTKTTTGTVNVGSATTYFAFGYNTLAVVYISATGSDASSGQNTTNVPAGTGPKLTMNGALSAVAEGGTIQTTAAGTFAGAYTLNKNVNFVSGAGAFTVSGTGTVTTKAVFPFAPADVNTGTDEITLTAHQLATGMPVTYDNLGSPYGFMPAGINTGSDELTVGANITTGQPVIYQAYPSSGAAAGLTHGTTYFAINTSPTTIKLAANYADALAGTPVVNITGTGTALSHGIISSVIQGLTVSTVYYTIVVDANTIKLATSNVNAISGTSIDLVTAGGGNHVVYFTPTYTGAGTFAGAAAMTISEPQSHIKGYFTLTNANPTISLGAGTYSMQPTINITKTMTFNGAGIGSTVLDGGGKISSATSYFGISLSGIAAGTVTISNLKITEYYNGIDRNSAVANVTTNIDNVESSDNFSRGVNFEGAGAISTALNIRNGIYSNNNGVGVNSHGINISGMSKTGVNIRNNTMSGNRTSAVEIGTGAHVSLIVRGNTISGTATVTPLSNGVTEMGIGVIQTAALTGSNSNISQNTINMYGRAGIECRGCLGNGAVSGVASFRITSNYINQAGGPFTSDPGTSNANETRDLAGIAVGNILAAGTPSGMVIDTNQVENLLQPNSASNVFTAFGIVSSGTSILNRLNIVTGCEVGIQVQQGAPGNEATSGDNFYGRDATGATTGFIANRNNITGNTVSGVRNEGTGAIQNFEGNWWGDPTGPNVASNISPSGAGSTYTSTGTIAYNAWLAEDPDDVTGTGLGQVGIQWNGPKHFRVKLSANASSLSTPNVLNQAVAVVSNGIYTDTVDVHTGTYSLSAETVVMSRRVYFRGNFGLSTKPVINGTGSSFPTGSAGGDNVAANQILLQVTSRFCGIENFQINVNVPFIGAGARIGIGTANNGTFSRLRVKNNIIENFGSTAFASWGMYLGSNSGVAGSDTVYVENNRISNRQGVNTSSFGRAIRGWYCNVQASGNTLLGIYSLQQASPRGVLGTNVTNNIMVGCHEINAPTGVTSVNISNNYYRVDSLSGGNHSANIEIRDNRTGTCPILIENNSFQGIGDAQCPYGVFSTMADDVTVRVNTFTPKSTANSFVLVLSTTKHQASSPLTAFSNGIDVYGNTFNGNSQVSSDKYGVIFANHNNTGDFNGGITLGTVAQPNTFKSNLSSWIYLDPLSGASSGAPSPYIWVIAGVSTTMVPTNVNIDATNNNYQVSGGIKLPGAMTLAELFDVEDKVTHAIDYGSLGFVTVKSSNAYVTTTSFISPETAPKISRAVTVSSDGWTISAKSNTYAETVTVDKSITLQNDGTTTLNNLTMNGTGKTLTLGSDFEVSTTGILTLTDGLINTGSNYLRVTNTASGAISGGSYLSHVVGNLNRAVTTGIQYDYTVGDGTDQQLLSLTFTTVSSLTDVNVRYTTTPPGTNLTTFNESGALYDDVLQTGYWIVEPNVGGTATNYSMRLKPINFTDYPTGAGIYSYTILKRVGAGNWGMNGVFDDPGTPERIFPDGTVRRSSMTGFSNFSIGTSQNVPLPLNLMFFSARKKGNSAEINWKTVNEKGVNRFELEKSFDGQNFTTITTEKSKNESGAEYTYSDADAFRLNQDVVYYRLKSVEQNGLPTYSAVRIVNRLSTTSETLTLFPNPVKDKVYVAGVNSQSAEVILTDATGKTINIIINEDGALNVKQLAPGIYLVRIFKDGTALDGRFVKE